MTERRRAQRALAAAEAEVRRLTERREEIATKPLLDEARRLRFLRRMDADIEAARARLIEAEADYECAVAQAHAGRRDDHVCLIRTTGWCRGCCPMRSWPRMTGRCG